MKCTTTENHAKTATHRNRSAKLLLIGGDNANGKSENRKIYKFPKKWDFRFEKNECEFWP